MLLQIENTVDEHRRSKYRILTILLVQAASEWIAVVMIDWSTLWSISTCRNVRKQQSVLCIWSFNPTWIWVQQQSGREWHLHAMGHPQWERPWRFRGEGVLLFPCSKLHASLPIVLEGHSLRWLSSWISHLHPSESNVSRNMCSHLRGMSLLISLERGTVLLERDWMGVLVSWGRVAHMQSPSSHRFPQSQMVQATLHCCCWQYYLSKLELGHLLFIHDSRLLVQHALDLYWSSSGPWSHSFLSLRVSPQWHVCRQWDVVAFVRTSYTEVGNIRRLALMGHYLQVRECHWVPSRTRRVQV